MIFLLEEEINTTTRPSQQSIPQTWPSVSDKKGKLNSIEKLNNNSGTSSEIRVMDGNPGAIAAAELDPNGAVSSRLVSTTAAPIVSPNAAAENKEEAEKKASDHEKKDGEAKKKEGEEAKEEKKVKELPPQALYDACKFGINLKQIMELVDFDKREELSWIEENMGAAGGLKTIIQALKTHPERGLSSSQFERENTDLLNAQDLIDKASPLVVKKKGPAEAVSARKILFGENKVPPPPPTTILEIIFETVTEDRILQILIGAAIISFIFGLVEDPQKGWVEGLAILIAVLLVLTITATNDYSKERKFNKILLLASDKKVKVIRDGVVISISSWEVVVGDVAILQAGDEVPADGIFIRSGEPRKYSVLYHNCVLYLHFTF